jgi:hypothetical protein
MHFSKKKHGIPPNGRHLANGRVVFVIRTHLLYLTKHSTPPNGRDWKDAAVAKNMFDVASQTRIHLRPLLAV